jgi:hypothetical protein
MLRREYFPAAARPAWMLVALLLSCIKPEEEIIPSLQELLERAE